MEDRVFVCIGRYKAQLEKQAVWVMTLDKEFKDVTLWNPVKHTEILLTERINKDQIQNLKAYLTPHKYQKDCEKAELEAFKKYRERIRKWREEACSESEDEGDEDAGDGEDEDLDMLLEDDGGKDKGNSSEEEYKADVDFIENDEIIVKHDDLAQVLKGYRVEQVGDTKALGRELQDDLEYRVDIEDREPEDDGTGDAQATNFFKAQREKMEREENMRDDKHLLPVTLKSKEKQVSDYGEIHLIFNHKNIWANLQNADPLKILYEIHDDNKWLPFIRDEIYPHRWDSEKDIMDFKGWLRRVQSEDIQSSDEPNDPERLKLKLETVDYLVKGEFMQPF